MSGRGHVSYSGGLDLGEYLHTRRQLQIPDGAAGQSRKKHLIANAKARRGHAAIALFDVFDDRRQDIQNAGRCRPLPHETDVAGPDSQAQTLTRTITGSGDQESALAALKAGNKGLVASEPVCQVFLTKARFDTGVDQRLTECHLSLASDCLCHASHTFCDVASG